jgi:hypothetical protein
MAEMSRVRFHKESAVSYIQTAISAMGCPNALTAPQKRERQTDRQTEREREKKKIFSF